MLQAPSSGGASPALEALPWLTSKATWHAGGATGVAWEREWERVWKACLRRGRLFEKTGRHTNHGTGGTTRPAGGAPDRLAMAIMVIFAALRGRRAVMCQRRACPNQYPRLAWMNKEQLRLCVHRSWASGGEGEQFMRSSARRAIALALAAIGLGGLPALAQKPGGTLRIYHRDNLPSASIHEEATISTGQPFLRAFNNLVLSNRQKPLTAPDAIVPDLADSRPFTAKDVQRTWNKLTGKDPDDFPKIPRAVFTGSPASPISAASIGRSARAALRVPSPSSPESSI